MKKELAPKYAPHEVLECYYIPKEVTAIACSPNEVR